MPTGDPICPVCKLYLALHVDGRPCGAYPDIRIQDMKKCSRCDKKATGEIGGQIGDYKFQLPVCNDCMDDMTKPKFFDYSMSAEHDLTFKNFQRINRERCEEDFGRCLHGDRAWTPEQWACALAGEVGELCNMIKKKYSRHVSEPGHKEIDMKDIGHEIADAVTYCDLLASFLGLDLGELVKEKFNIVSDRIGSKKKL